MAGADCGTELILVLGGESGASSGRAGIGAAGIGIGDGEEGGPKLVHGHGRLQLTRVLGCGLWKRMLVVKLMLVLVLMLERKRQRLRV